jgi:hypothetical protein
VALLIAASGAAVAAIPSSDGTINACRDTRTGTLRVINAEGGQRCTTKETQLAWKDGITGKVADSEKFDGRDSTDFAKAYKRTVVVSPVGTDTDNGQALLDALSGITDASATKPYLLYIEPGTYDLGTGWLQMKEHVDIQGAGELQTLITRSTPSTDCPSAPSASSTVSGANNAELRYLTVQNMGGSNTDCRIAIFNDSASPHLTHVTAEASGSSGIDIGVFNSGNSSPTMTDVTATAPGGPGRGVGVLNGGTSSPTIRQSKLTGDFALLVGTESGSTPDVKVALTQLVGPVFNRSSGTLRCFNNYDHNLAPVTCP